VLKIIGDIAVKQHSRNVNMPGRKYIGDSIVLRGRVRDLITTKVKNCFK
jgi:hypothetical protein